MIIKQLIIIFAMCIFATSCQNEKTATEPSAVPKSSKTQTVEVEKPKPRSFNADMLISGTAMPNQKALIHAMESGYLKNVHNDIGDYVKKGQILAELENPEISQLLSEAEANLIIEKAKLQTINSDKSAMEVEIKTSSSYFARLRKIQETTPQLTPIVEVEKAEAAAEKAEAALKSLLSKMNAQEEKIKAYEQRLQFAQTRFNMLLIKAPFSGIISQRFFDKGTTVQSGITESSAKPLFEIQDINPIRLTLPIPEADAAAVKKGMDVNITFPELEGGEFTAKISRTAKSLDASSRTMQVEIDIANPKGTIISGMYAKARMQLGSRENSLSLPLKAIVMHQGLPHVYTVNDNRVQLKAVRKGLSGKDYFEVLNSDISAESMVIIQGKGLVKSGDTVKPIMKKE